MITYDIDYSPEAIRDMDEIFDDVLMVSCDLDVTHRYLDDLQDDSFEEAALDELGIYDDEGEEDTEYDEAPEDEEIEKSISHTGYEAFPVEAVEKA